MRKVNTLLITLLLISTIVVPNTYAKEPRLVIELPRWSGYDIAIHPDGEIIASASLDKIIHTFNLENGKAIEVLRGHEKGVETVAYSPNGKLLVSGDQNGLNILWDTTTNRQIRELDLHAWVIKDIEFSRNELIASNI